jgi:predicted amino acid dehydrogenase
VSARILRPSSIVCDVSRPSNVADDVRSRRPDVKVFDGGIIRLPFGASLGFNNATLGANNAYACMCETMMLAMEKRYEDMSLGFDLRMDQVFEIERLAETLGFQVRVDRAENANMEDAHDMPQFISETEGNTALSS